VDKIPSSASCWVASASAIFLWYPFILEISELCRIDSVAKLNINEQYITKVKS
jgi:hypothetical protein